MLNSVLYDDLRGYKDLNFLKSTVCFLLLWLMLPFFALCYLVAPKCRISKLLNTPVLKFMSHTASFLWFLVLLILSSIQDKFLDDVFAFSPLGKHFLFFFCWISCFYVEGQQNFWQKVSIKVWPVSSSSNSSSTLFDKSGLLKWQRNTDVDLLLINWINK